MDQICSVSKSIINAIGGIKKIGNNKTIINGSLFSLFSFINKGMGFLLLMLLANILLPSDYGYLSLFTTIVSLVSYFIGASTEGYLGVAYFKEGSLGVRNTLSGITAISFFIFVFLNAILFIWGKQLESLLSLPIPCLYIAVIICFFTLYVNLLLDYVRLKEKVWIYGALSCSNALINFILSILFIKSLSLGWEGRMYAQVISFFIYGLIGILFFSWNHYINKPDIYYIKKMLIWGVPIIPHLAASFVRQGCDRYIINYFYNIEDVGLFSFGLNIASIITMIGVGFNQSNSVEIYKVLSDNSISAKIKNERLKKQRSMFWRIYIASWSFVVVFGYALFPLFFPRYNGALLYFLILSIFSLFFCVYLIYTNYLFYYHKTRLIMYVTFSCSLLHLLLSLLLTRYSLVLTSLTYVFTQFIVSALIMYFAHRSLKTNIS